MIGFGFGAGMRGVKLASAAVDVPDPTLLSWKGFWQQPDYAEAAGSGTWTGTASAGTSGTFNLVEATTEPAAVSGEPDFNGTTHMIYDAACTFGSLFAVGAGTCACVFYADTAYADQPSVYSNPPFINDRTNAGFGLHFSAGGVAANIYDGTAYREREIACSAAAMHTAIMRWDGATLGLKLDGGAWSETACANYAYATSTRLTIGQSIAGTFLDGRIRVLAGMNTKIADADATDFHTWAQSVHGST